MTKVGAWSRRNVWPGAVTLDELAVALDLHRSTVWRQLRRQGLAAHLITRVWPGPDGRIWTRRVLAIPRETARQIVAAALHRRWHRSVRELTRLGLEGDQTPCPWCEGPTQ